MKLSLLFGFFVILFSFAGCGKSLPDGLPPLAPCKVKIHDNGSPLENIGVTFSRTEGQSGWSLNGQTGSDGVAIAQTIVSSFDAKGLPVGTYRVALSERIELPSELIENDDIFITEKQRADIAKKRERYLAEHQKVPAVLCNPSKTPLELTVTDSGGDLDVDISKFK